MNSRRYVICDIEATGLHEDKDLIEIALITFQDEKIVEVYETLINPQVPVSGFVKELTGITQRELDQAPKFHEVADSIRIRLEGNTFVSHNTDFDFGLLAKKFSERGENIKCRTMCTLRMAEELIPGLLNYNLDALSAFFGIKIRDRHRAGGDALATLEIFRELLKLRTNSRALPLWLPHHEKLLKDIPKKAGLLKLIDESAKVVRMEATDDLEKKARQLLEVRPENRELLLSVKDLQFALTGSALIAEFEKLKLQPVHYHWMVTLESDARGEQKFFMRPYRKDTEGIWFYPNYAPARAKARELNSKLQERKFIYQEGGKSKEEIVRSNQKAQELSKLELFPTPHLIIIGEGRTLHERSFILIRDDHVKGFGFTDVPEEKLIASPEAWLTRNFHKNLGVDIAARRYIRVLKNLRQKTERWQGLSAKTMLEGSL
ncbi:MAG: PolC-type DNA polymerase III [Bacteriovoracaceae bacterium]